MNTREQQGSPSPLTRRHFLSCAVMTGAALWTGSEGWSQEGLDPRGNAIVSKTIGIDTHNHVDVPLTQEEMPGAAIDLRAQLKRSGLSAISMTFATDYQPGDAYQRFLNGLASMDRQLKINNISRALSAADVSAAHRRGEPTVIQAIEGAHFLEGKLDRVQVAYGRGVRHLGLLHDSDASVPLGDVYTNTPKHGGLTEFGKSVVKECNRLGILLDLAHANAQTTEMALRLSSRPVVISHTGLDTQLGSDPHMAQMMRPRLISKAQARMVADAGGAIGVWTHLSDTPLQYAQNMRALVDVVGVDHVCIGTDTKLTQPSPRRPGPPRETQGSQARRPDSPIGEGQPFGGPRNGQGPGGPRVGERTNQAWSSEQVAFYPVVVDALLKTGFTAEEIGKIGGGNYLRIFNEACRVA